MRRRRRRAVSGGGGSKQAGSRRKERDPSSSFSQSGKQQRGMAGRSGWNRPSTEKEKRQAAHELLEEWKKHMKSQKKSTDGTEA